MASDSNGEEGEPRALSSKVLARGGPIYFPNAVGSLLHPQTFKRQILYELQALELELRSDSMQNVGPDDIFVDDLKVFSDEELVDMALKKALKVNEDTITTKQPSLAGQLVKSTEECSASSALSIVPCSDALFNDKKAAISLVKRKRRKKDDIDESYLERVEELVILKHKQDEDRESAKTLLQSGNVNKNEGSMPSIEGFERIRSLMSGDSVKKRPKCPDFHEHVHFTLPETLLCVEVYENKRIGDKSEEFLVLGSQFLTEIKDLINCMTDKIMKKADRYDPSGYFLIEDVFYNDMRDPKAIDYSEPIFEWLQNSSSDALEKWSSIITGDLKKKQKEVVGEAATPHLPHFKHEMMDKTRFRDLEFRLGAGYVYCHQGDCKHTLVFRDVRMIDEEDVQNAASYPLVFQRKARIVKCNVCGIYKATQMTVNDKWAKLNPCYFCDACYFYLHYKQDGSLLYNDFSVYNCA